MLTVNFSIPHPSLWCVVSKNVFYISVSIQCQKASYALCFCASVPALTAALYRYAEHRDESEAIRKRLASAGDVGPLPDLVDDW